MADRGICAAYGHLDHDHVQRIRPLLVSLDAPAAQPLVGAADSNAHERVARDSWLHIIYKVYGLKLSWRGLWKSFRQCGEVGNTRGFIKAEQ